MNKTARAFTLVELAITIAIIAILAVISVVAYNGVQNRARTAAYTSAADQAEKQLQVMASFDQAGVFNLHQYTEDGWIMGGFCLGAIVDFPAADGFDAGECLAVVDSAGQKVASMRVNEAYTTALRQLDPSFSVGLLPTSSTKVGAGSWTYRGRGVVASPNGGKELILQWITPDKTSCGRGEGMAVPELDMFVSVRADLIAVRDGLMSWNDFVAKYYGDDDDGGAGSPTNEEINSMITVYDGFIELLGGSDRGGNLCTRYIKR